MLVLAQEGGLDQNRTGMHWAFASLFVLERGREEGKKRKEGEEGKQIPDCSFAVL